MNLLYMLPEYVTHAGGGIITFYRHFLPLLARQGHQVRVIVGSGATAESTTSRRIIDGVSVETLNHGLLLKYHAMFSRYVATPGLRRSLAAAWAMREQADYGVGIDVVEAADWGLLFLPWVVDGGPPCIIQLHGSMGQIDTHDPVRGEELQGQIIRLLECAGIRQAVGAQAYSLGNAAFWQRQAGRPVERIHPAWQPLIADVSRSGREQKGLVVGRLQRWKGPEVLCEALTMLGSRAPEIDWIGRDTPYERRSTMTSAYLAKAWPAIWERHLFHRPQQSADITCRLQAEAAFVVVPSLWDTFNFTCVESMAAGTPVICSTGAGASELIENGVNGFLFEAGNAGMLAEAIDHLLALGFHERKELGEAGRQAVMSATDLATRARQRLAAYESVARRGPQVALASDDWLRLACAPANAAADSLDFLDHLALKPLAAHTLRRIGRKVSPKW
jgi:glycosyltransferase involved in cell wall biosynthesis